MVSVRPPCSKPRNNWRLICWLSVPIAGGWQDRCLSRLVGNDALGNAVFEVGKIVVKAAVMHQRKSKDAGIEQQATALGFCIRHSGGDKKLSRAFKAVKVDQSRQPPPLARRGAPSRVPPTQSTCLYGFGWCHNLNGDNAVGRAPCPARPWLFYRYREYDLLSIGRAGLRARPVCP